LTGDSVDVAASGPPRDGSGTPAGLPRPRAAAYIRQNDASRWAPLPQGTAGPSRAPSSDSGQGPDMPPTATATPQWGLHPNHAPEAAADLARALGAPLALGHALVNRGVAREEAARRFLDPVLEDLHEPARMLDLEPAAERVLAAVASGERVFIHGDYDVDGITSTFLLFSALEELGARVEYRIPHRIRDGYGRTRGALAEAHRR